MNEGPSSWISTGLISILSVLQTTTNSTSTNTTSVCDPSLLKNGTEKEEYGLCPETVSSQAVSGILLGTYLIFVVFTIASVIKTRKVPLVKYREVAVMIGALLLTGLFAFIFILRLTVGRKIFPCFIYMLTYFFAAPVVFFPTLLRLWRLIWMSRLNKTRVELFRLEESLIKKGGEPRRKRETVQVQPSTSSGNVSDVEDSPGTGSGIVLFNTTTVTDTDSYDEDSDDSDSDAGSVTMEMDDSLSTSSGGVTTDEKLNSLDPNQGIRRQMSKASGLHKSVLANAISTVTQEELAKYIALETRIVRIQHVLKWWFYLAVTIVFSFLHLLIWLICGLVETFYLSSYPDSTKFTVTADFFVFNHGCGAGTGTLITVAVQGLSYLVAILVLLIFTLREDNDTWRIRVETFTVLILWVLWIVAYIIAGLIPVVGSLTDAYFAYGLILFFAVVTDNIVTGFIPAVRAIAELISVYSKQKGSVKRNKDVEEEEGVTTVEKGALIKMLRDKKMFDILLAFAKQSYCPESVL